MGNGENDRGTPPELFAKLHAICDFTLDAAASKENALLPRFYTIEDSALEHSWAGERVFMNPPYGRGVLEPFVKKACEEVNIGDCELVVALLPVRTEQPWFHKYVWRVAGADIVFLKGRLRYDGLKTAAPFPSMIVMWRG